MHKTKARVACVIGTRPEVIKMAPVIAAIRASNILEPFVVCTAQHRQLLDNMLSIFNIKPDVDMNIMQHNQSLAILTGNLFTNMENLFVKEKFDAVIAQGDTTTTMVASQIAFYHRIPYGHVEAGLRSYDLHHPFPEEMNRVFVSQVATWHFVPTKGEKENLLKERVPEKNIFITGNTVIDALYMIAKRNAPLPASIPANKRIILMTLHRRESFGKPIQDIFAAVKILTEKFPDIQIVYPVHPNPNVHSTATNMLGNVPGVTLLDPLPYDVFVSLMDHAYFMMSDSGGIQEEAPALNKPVLVLRKVTERPLVIELGLGKLVGTDKDTIVDAASELLTNTDSYNSMRKGISPYGDGYAAERIVDVLNAYFNKDA